MPIQRDTKTLSKRLDRAYFERRSTLRQVRVVAIVLCCIIALAWWASAGTKPDSVIYNPGPVASAHASFQNNCLACHTGDEKGGFLLAVTDNACIKCHDGSIHNPNQKVARSNSELGGLTLAISDANHPAGMRSGSCVACHIEHRGEKLMTASHDATCIRCHANLKDAAQTASSAKDHVVSFTLADHPDFGRKMRVKSGETERIVDPIVLEFNHRKHLQLEQFSKPDSCTKCHTPDIANGGLYMKPIRYDRDCMSCHAIAAPSVVLQTKRGPRVTNETLLAETPVPHATMDVVTSFAAQHVGRTIAEKQFADPKTTDEFVKKVGDKLASDLSKAKFGDRAFAGKAFKLDGQEIAPGSAGQALMTDLYATSIATNTKGCVLCHSLQQTNAKVSTVPTGYAGHSNRWYAASRFDHAGHRSMSCTECHAALSPESIASRKDEARVPQIEDTSYFNSPGISWKQTVKDGEAFKTVTRSCVECHHADTSSGRGVASECVSCHNFHDRTKQR